MSGIASRYSDTYIERDGDKMIKRATNGMVPPWSETVTPEWLGAESHVPSLKRELQGQGRSNGRLSLRWTVFSVFLAGLAIGSVVTLLTDPRRLRA
jgi:hypothetical protein